MSCDVFIIPPFDKQLKRLAKKYPSLKNEFAKLLASLEQEPEQGTKIGNNYYKIRIAIASKGKGKRGGGRVITNFVIDEESVFLISKYDKSEKENLTDKELEELLKYVPQ
jgi:mRNA-degrading endonuclease RelE of RelBE toxin-antitoxin system